MRVGVYGIYGLRLFWLGGALARLVCLVVGCSSVWVVVYFTLGVVGGVPAGGIGEVGCLARCVGGGMVSLASSQVVWLWWVGRS